MNNFGGKMTFGEKVSNIIDWITGYESDPGRVIGCDDDYDDGYEVDRNLAKKPAFTTKVSDDKKMVPSIKNYKEHEVKIIEPRSFGDTSQIVQQLLENKTVVLNLHLLDKEQAQRTIDFVCGAVHALGGSPQKVGDSVFVFTPNSVQLSVESRESNFGTEGLWMGNI